MKRRFVGIFVIFMVLSMATAGCSSPSAGSPANAVTSAPAGAETNTAPSSDGGGNHTLIVASDGDPLTSVDRFGGLGVPGDDVCQLVFDYLVLSDHRKGYTPMLAKSWEISDDFLVYTFHLRDDAYFIDGTKETSADIAATFQRVFDNPSFQDATTWIDPVDSWETPDETTFILKLKVAMPTFFDELGRFPIICKAAFEANPDTYFVKNIISAGPYKVTGFDQTTGQVDVVKNDSWWGWNDGFSTNVTEITYKSIPEETTRVSALRAGDVDVCYGITIDNANLLRNAGFTVEDILTDSYCQIVFNCAPGMPFENEDLRRAFSYAIDRETIVSSITGCGLPMDFPAPSNNVGYVENYANGYKYDLEQAKQLVASSGYDGREITILTGTQGWVRGDEVLQAIQSMLADAGINAKLNSMDSATRSAHIRAGEYEVVVMNFANTCSDPLKLFTQWAADTQKTGYVDDGWRAYCLEIAQTPDLEKRIPKMQEAFSTMVDNMAPNAYVYQQTKFYAYKSDIASMPIYADGSASLFFVMRGAN
jgi:peptide/nickel transport system substrate-binding protein